MPRRRKKSKWRVKDAPRGLQYDYYKALAKYTRQVGAVFEKTVFPVVDSVATGAMDTEDPLGEAFELFVSRVAKLSKTEVSRAAVKMVNGVERFQRDLFVSNIKRTVGVDVTSIIKKSQVKDEIAAAIAENLKLIKTIDLSYVERGNKIIRGGLKTARSPIDIRKDLYRLGGFKDEYHGTEIRRAKVIARDQSQKMAKAIDHVRNKQMGVKHFYWLTAGDGRVRDTHYEYRNKRYSYADPPGGELPGDAVQCRCHERPDTEELLTALENGAIVGV